MNILNGIVQGTLRVLNKIIAANIQADDIQSNTISATTFTGDLSGNATSASTANSVAWTNVSGKPNYAGSASQGGSATMAERLATSCGDTNNPVYFLSGKPVPISYEINKSVPADANFDDTTYSTGDTTTSGLTKLYTDTGNATDGTLTQKAMTDELNTTLKKTGGQMTGDLQVLRHPYIAKQTYTNVIGTSSSAISNIFYFGLVRPDVWTKEWHIKYEITSYITNQNASSAAFYGGHFIVEMNGAQESLTSYKIFNSHYSSQYRSLAAHIFSYMYSDTYNNMPEAGHAIGLSLYNSTNPTTATYARTFEIHVLEATNCSVQLMNTMQTSSGWTDFYTYYDSYEAHDGQKNGLVESGTDGKDTAHILKYSQNIKAGSAITQGALIVGNNGLYSNLKLGNAFDITYPILWAENAITKNATSKTNYLVYPVTITTTQSMSFTLYKPVYIKGHLSGVIFTPASTAPLTQTVPTTSDGFDYMLLGMAYSSTGMYLLTDHTVYAYKNGYFSQSLGRATY